ncbi:acetoacetate--CoA ligase [Streptosporangium sp. NPDC051022]|uniref:acetoacetate--CoA ligase n=1 Tax=Streptosporangium sp. NPDC051022 TaxID=3155752 RepID=UPI003417C504
MITAEDATFAHPVRPGLLSEPPADIREHSQIGHYLDWLERERGLAFATYDELWEWSVTDLEAFWVSIWDYFAVTSHTPYERVLSSREMPGAKWFEGATLNLAEHMLRHRDLDDQVAVVAVSQTRADVELTFGQVREQVQRAQAGLKALGVRRGDRVAAYLPNIPETMIAYLATISLGAIWASCAPEFGATGVLDRFGQIEPKVLLVVDGYMYGDKRVERVAEAQAIRAGLPSVEHVVHVPYLDQAIEDAVTWEELLSRPVDPSEPMAFEAVPFDHPVSVLFTSGTTGQPKPIVHGHGGLLLEHLKNHALHWDLGAGDRLLWFTTTAWMMWNALVSTLLVRAGIVMIDGNIAYPDVTMQWRLAERTRPTVMGVSAGLLMQCRRESRHLAKEFDLSTLHQLGVVGSPLPPEGYQYVHEQFGDGVLLNVGSGGTDVCSGIVQGNPLEPVWLGEMSGRSLGVEAYAFDEHGKPVVGELGELVITAPMPSMPVGFWGDADGSGYRAAYFDVYPGVWRHGDWIRFSEAGSCVITGRSDATLNRGGVRLGTAEYYRVVEGMPEIADSLVVHLEDSDGGVGELILFVTLAPGAVLDDALLGRIRSAIRTRLSPRHAPDEVVATPAIPHTRTGKKLELPIKRILSGRPVEAVLDPDAVDDAGALAFFATRGAGR